MQKHHNFLETLIKDSQTNIEILLETYFQSVNGNISDVELLQTLARVSKNMRTLQSRIDFHVRNTKRHK